MTTVEGVDYSYARPNLRCLFDPPNNRRFVVRYVQNTPTAKNMTAAEVRDIIAAELAVVTVCQRGTSPMLEGRTRGIELATGALRDATACGMPTDRPIYFALDVDTSAFTTASWGACKAFLDGAATVLGRDSVGVYGDRRTVDTLCPTWAPWGWQTYAWSGGVWSTKAQLQQYRNNVTLCGGNVDYDRAVVADYGQWGQTTGGHELTDDDKRWLVNTFVPRVWA